MKSRWQEGQWPTLSQSSLACGWGGGQGREQTGTLTPGRWAWPPAAKRLEPGQTQKRPVRALEVVLGGRARDLEAGSGHGAGWDPGTGAWPSALI